MSNQPKQLSTEELDHLRESEQFFSRESTKRGFQSAILLGTTALSGAAAVYAPNEVVRVGAMFAAIGMGVASHIQGMLAFMDHINARDAAAWISQSKQVSARDS